MSYESKMRVVIESVPTMLAYWDADQRCRFANRAYEKWFGVAPETLLGMTMQALLGPIYPMNLPYIEGALRGERQEFEREIPDPRGGAARHSLAVYTPDVEDGVVRGFSVVVSDITRQKVAEEELRVALGQVKTLQGLVAVCAWCRKIRDDHGSWQSLEKFVVEHTDARLTHGMCEECAAAAGAR